MDCRPPYPKAAGVARFQPLICPPQFQPPILSFWNLIEAHVLRSLRTDHGVSVKGLRKALEYAERSVNIERLLRIRYKPTSLTRSFDIA